MITPADFFEKTEFKLRTFALHFINNHCPVKLLDVVTDTYSNLPNSGGKFVITRIVLTKNQHGNDDFIYLGLPLNKKLQVISGRKIVTLINIEISGEKYRSDLNLPHPVAYLCLDHEGKNNPEELCGRLLFHTYAGRENYSYRD